MRAVYSSCLLFIVFSLLEAQEMPGVSADEPDLSEARPVVKLPSQQAGRAPATVDGSGRVPDMKPVAFAPTAEKRFNRMPEVDGSQRITELDSQDRSKMVAPFPRLPQDMEEMLARERADSETVPTELEDKLMNTPYQQLQSDLQRPPGCTNASQASPPSNASYVKSFVLEQTEPDWKRGVQNGLVASLQMLQKPADEAANDNTGMWASEGHPRSTPQKSAVAHESAPHKYLTTKPPPPQATQLQDGKPKALIPLPKTLMFVTMRVPAWSPIQVNLDTRYTARTVKMILENRYNLRNVKLYYGGYEVTNETSIEEAGIKYNSDVYVVPQCTLEIRPPPTTVPKQVRLPPPKLKEPCSSKVPGMNSTGCPVVVSLNPEIALPVPNNKCVDGDCKTFAPPIPKPSPNAIPKMSYVFAENA